MSKTLRYAILAVMFAALLAIFGGSDLISEVLTPEVDRIELLEERFADLEASQQGVTDTALAEYLTESRKLSLNIRDRCCRMIFGGPLGKDGFCTRMTYTREMSFYRCVEREYGKHKWLP